MSVFEILSDRVLDPCQEIIDQTEMILDKSIPEYLDAMKPEGEERDWDDDPDLLAEILNRHSIETSVKWNVVSEGRTAVDWYVHSAIVDGDGNLIFNLHPESIDGKWGPKSFREVIMKFAYHEGIHLAQRDRMGKEKYKSIPSGYMKGVRAASKTGDFNIIAQYYFKDPQEIMAHASDLAYEIVKLPNLKKAIRNPDKYIDKLPTYDKHVKHGFTIDSKVTKKLMRYTVDYLRKRGVEI